MNINKIQIKKRTQPKNKTNNRKTKINKNKQT